jgi:hypothetical protein
MHYVKTNKEGSLKILRKHLQISDPEAVDGTYEFFAKRLPRSPRTEPEGIKNIWCPSMLPIKSSGLYRMGIIDEIGGRVYQKLTVHRSVASTNDPQRTLRSRKVRLASEFFASLKKLSSLVENHFSPHAFESRCLLAH